MLTLNQNYPDYFGIGLAGGGKFTFDCALYFVLITITTVGYGDVYPSTTFSRVIVGVFFVAAIVFFTM
jgi:voltage-gated potassium channel